MKILYSGVQYANYAPHKGLSFEHRNFCSALTAMPGVEVVYVPFDRILEVGTKKFNEELLEAVRREKPDLFFCFMYSEEFEQGVLAEMRKYTTTMAWFGDDYWRFWNYSRRWAPHFDWVVTTSAEAARWYAEVGHMNVIHSQWACNTAEYKPVAPPPEKDIEVSFVGQRRSGRARMVTALRGAGIHVACFGSGWEKGRVSHEEMLRVFGRSAISLNLAERKRLWDPSVVARIFLKKSVNRIVPDFHILDNLRAWRHFSIPHIHARPFELAGCRAFVLSSYVEGIEAYYEPDKEMVFYRSVPECIEKIRYFLAHEGEREAIARAGYERTLRDHTWEKRFGDIFVRIGLR
ncbi:MAG: glycosyltransferase [Candidatus Liptonbacteria bacterium]|nr:glycosyltransferase [Candidatus Liptonbacteria bacterium]